jgi:hypothetical protein
MPFESSQWIWAKDNSGPNQYILARQDFTAAECEKAALFISADAQYVTYVNGMLVGFGQYADLPEFKVYDEIDVSGCLHAGQNHLEIGAYCPVTESSVYRPGRPALIFEVCAGGKIIAVSGADTLTACDPSYKSGEADLITKQMGYTFEYNARAVMPEFEQPDVFAHTRSFHSRPVKRLVLQDRAEVFVVSQGVYREDFTCGTIGKRMQYSSMAFRENEGMTGHPVQPSFPEEAVRYVAEDGSGIWIVADLGKETVGFLELELTVPQACEILIGWGEHTDDLRVRTYVGGRNFAARFRAKAGPNYFTHLYRKCGLRYIQLFIASYEVEIQYAGVQPVSYPLCELPAFHTADGLHSRIFHVCRETLKDCLHEHYEDCPWREQALYAMDSRNQMLCGYYAFGEYEMPRESLRLLALSLRDDGLLELCAPASVPITIPGFSAVFVLALEEYLMYSGDETFVHETLPVASAIVDGMLSRRAECGLIPAYTGDAYWNFYEWRPGLDGSEKVPGKEEDVRFDAPLNMLAAEAASRIAHMLDLLKMPGANAYRAEAEKLRLDTDRLFRDLNTGLYYSYRNGQGCYHISELANALAVYCGVCPYENEDVVLQSLADGKLSPISLSYSIFLFEALLKKGERYARMAFGRISRVWGDMLMRGATTFGETEAGGWDFDRAGSLCHAWSAVPLYLYMAYALGVKPLEPGYAKYVISPVPCGLYEVSGKIMLPDGRMLQVG